MLGRVVAVGPNRGSGSAGLQVWERQRETERIYKEGYEQCEGWRQDMTAASGTHGAP